MPTCGRPVGQRERTAMALTPPGAVVWDMDGTLVDTADLHFAAWARLARELDRPFTRADFAATFGRRNPEILRSLFGDQLTDDEVDTLGERKENYYRATAQQGVE